MTPVEGAGLSVGGRRDTPPSPTPPKPARTEREVRSTPFKRSRSRVYYASQTDSWNDNGGNGVKSKPARRDLGFNSSQVPVSVEPQDARTTPSSRIVTTPRSNALRKISPSYRDSFRSSPDTRVSLGEPAIVEAGEEASSSGEEAGEGELSPGGSFRGSLRGSPSHRSQDSGYSDSGESTNAHNDSDGSPTTPPNVKHITRVYFSESHEQARLYNDKIVCSPELKGHNKVSTPNPSPTSPVLPSVVSSPRVSPSNSSSSSSSHGSPTCNSSIGNLEELSEELEHKSVQEAARRTGAVRKRPTNNTSASGAVRRPQRRANSSDKLLSDTRQDQRRQTPLRAKRRWSAADLTPQQRKHHQSPETAGSYTSRSTSTNDLPLQDPLAARVGAAWSLDALDDPLPASRVAGKTPSGAATLPFPSSSHGRKLRIHPAAIAKEMKNGSVSQWLNELGVLYEAECMNTLQSKCLPGDVTPPRASSSSTTTTRHAVRAIQRRAHAVSTEFARLCQRLEWLEMSSVPTLAESLVNHINNFLRDYTTQWTAAPPDLHPQCSVGRQSKVIEQICGRLKEVCGRNLTQNLTKQMTPEGQDTTRQVVQVVTALGHAFTKLVDLMLTREIRVVVRMLEDPGGEDVSQAVSHLTALGVDGGHICRLIARLGGVRALLSLCLEPRKHGVRVAALRALATVCCVVDGIIELERAGGVEVVAEVLCDLESPEEERSEAAGVLAQVTSPWVDDNHRLVGLHAHMNTIVTALTGLASSTRSAEIFLLASAALANLTFLDGGCVAAMREAGTARVLLKAARDNPAISIFTKDQIATVLANLAASTEAGEEVDRYGGVSVLLELLKTTPAHTHRLPELATAERVQQKSAIAISRLCGNPSVARKVAELGGAERLVRLCKDEEERNHSDAVLVACLAALRKMASSLGSEELRDMDAAELVEPRLLDSFLTYSSRQESYV